jgi:serine protease
MNKKIACLVAVALAVSASLPASGAVQNTVLSWGLDRVDQTSPTLDGVYSYPDHAGAGVRVYVMDTGVQANLAGFGGRVAVGYDALAKFREPNQSGADCNGHGTTVAGIIGSSTYGVAKSATIVPVRVAGCDGGVFPESIVKGIDWIIKNHPRNTAGVVNISLAVNKSKAVDDAVARLYNAGLVPVVAAGNFATDACRFSPAGAPRALTVGSTNQNDYRTNTSNFGNCVNLFAPGGLIPTEGLRGETVSTGTSMSAPFVAGAIALYLAQNPKARPAQVIGAITKGSQVGAVINSNSKSSLLLSTSFLK